MPLFDASWFFKAHPASQSDPPITTAFASFFNPPTPDTFTSRSPTTEAPIPHVDRASPNAPPVETSGTPAPKTTKKKKRAANPVKSCGVCKDFSVLRKKKNPYAGVSGAAATSAAAAEGDGFASISTPTGIATSPSFISHPTSAGTPSQEQQQQQQQQIPTCPPDWEQLGRSTWTFLHSMAAYYPANPTPTEQLSMRAMITGLGRFYPCSYCSRHLRQEILRHPPDVSSNVALSRWFCEVHNEVNEREEKPQFDCSKVFERWKDGPPAGVECQDA
ncbi:ERV/ALR sulfhydryl oxidase domain-containing protein [Phlyctochytrium arcticum]|nr:ERV/ALR sulfhydryl oxidase domain-containing protein [Phlyctochytrium arcticum]